MNFRDILTTASTNMFRAKLRTSLTIIAIFIGAFTLTLTNGLGAGIAHYIDQQLGNLGAKDLLIIQAATQQSIFGNTLPIRYDTNHKTSSNPNDPDQQVTLLTNNDLAKINAVAGVHDAKLYQTAAIDYVTTGGKYKYVASLTPISEGERHTLIIGRNVTVSSLENQVLLPEKYRLILGFSTPAEAVGKAVRFGVTDATGVQSEVSATITGVEQISLLGGTDFGANDSLISALRAAAAIGLPTPPTGSAYATARFDPAINPSDLTAIKNRLFDAGYTAKTVADQVNDLKSVIAAIIMVLNGFAVVALLAASFGIINTLLMSVQERIREIGLMKAMGMSAGRIFLMFSLEAMMLGFWGSLFGSLIAIATGILLSRLAANTITQSLVGLQLFTFPMFNTIAIIVIVMLIAFLAGTLPALRASRQSPIDSLRYE